MTFLEHACFLYPGQTVSRSISATEKIALLGLLVIIPVVIGLVVRAQRSRILSGKEALSGLKGEVVTDIPSGKKGRVAAQGTYWNAVADVEILQGSEVIIVSVDEDMTIKVRKA